MQIQKVVLGPKFRAHIVEQSNDQGLILSLCPQGRVVYVRRRVVQYWWTKLNTLIFAVLSVNFFYSMREFYSYKLQNLQFSEANCRLPAAPHLLLIYQWRR